MTREEAIMWIKTLQEDAIFEVNEALLLAIEALQAEPTKAVPPSLADVYKWERDIALSQLEEYGIGFAEKKRDDLVSVVRCKDCRWYERPEAKIFENCCRNNYLIPVEPNDYCSFGERREESEAEE